MCLTPEQFDSHCERTEKDLFVISGNERSRLAGALSCRTSDLGVGKEFHADEIEAGMRLDAACRGDH